MSPAALWALIALGLAIVVVRRRTHAIALVAAQSLVLGALAIDGALADGSNLALAVAIPAARGIALPLLLLAVVRRTRERRRLASERFALPRLLLAVAAVAVAASVVPAEGFGGAGADRATLALLVLGIVIAAVRRPVVFQAVGFLVAENGVYLAGVAVHGGVPGALELALAFDLVAVLAVAAVFGGKIHERFGSGDTDRLRGLRD